MSFASPMPFYMCRCFYCKYGDKMGYISLKLYWYCRFWCNFVEFSRKRPLLHCKICCFVVILVGIEYSTFRIFLSIYWLFTIKLYSKRRFNVVPCDICNGFNDIDIVYKQMCRACSQWTRNRTTAIPDKRMSTISFWLRWLRIAPTDSIIRPFYFHRSDERQFYTFRHHSNWISIHY